MLHTLDLITNQGDEALAAQARSKNQYHHVVGNDPTIYWITKPFNYGGLVKALVVRRNSVGSASDEVVNSDDQKKTRPKPYNLISSLRSNGQVRRRTRRC